MINKSLSIQSELRIKEEAVGFLNCQIGCGMDSALNLSIQITDKELCEKYEEEVRNMCVEFMRMALNEAVETGWNILKVEF